MECEVSFFHARVLDFDAKHLERSVNKSYKPHRLVNYICWTLSDPHSAFGANLKSRDCGRVRAPWRTNYDQPFSQKSDSFICCFLKTCLGSPGFVVKRREEPRSPATQNWSW